MQNELRLLHYYWELVWRRPLIWMVPAIVVLLAGLAYILAQPRTYTSEATLVVKSDRISPTLVQSTVVNERLQFIEQRVLARDNLVALAEKFDLFPELRNAAPKSRLASMVRSQISILADQSQSFDQSTGLSTFRVRFESGSPELAAAVTTEIVSMIVGENRRTRLSQASDATQFLEREVTTLNDRLKGLDEKWDEFVKTNQNSLPSRQTAHLEEIRTGQTELTTIDTRAAELSSEIQLLKAELDLRLPFADAATRSRAEQLTTLKAQLATRLSVLSEAHPEIKTLRSRIATLEEEVSRANAAAVRADTDGVPDPETLEPELGLVAERIKAAQQRLAALTERRENLNSNLTELRGVLARMPEVEAEMISLQRQRTATQQNLDEMTSKLNTARLSERLESNQQADQIEVLEQAEIPEYATGPNRRKMLLVVLILAAGAGLAAVLATDIMDKTIRGTFDISRALEGRALVVVPDWSDEPANAVLKKLRNMFAGFILLVGAGQAAQHAYAPANEPAQPAVIAQAA